jgi:hypothetical protein
MLAFVGIWLVSGGYPWPGVLGWVLIVAGVGMGGGPGTDGTAEKMTKKAGSEMDRRCKLYGWPQTFVGSSRDVI